MLALLLGATLTSVGTFLVLLLTILVAGMWEFYHLARLGGARPQRLLGLMMGVLLFIFAIVFFPFPRILILLASELCERAQDLRILLTS